MQAARTILSQDGPEGLSLAKVARLAGVNRGTAYQHFETREHLIESTSAWVSESLVRAVYGNPEALHDPSREALDISELVDRLASFAMENPELCQVWLMQVLSSPGPAKDPFWKAYEGSTEHFIETENAERGIDSEVLSVLMLAGAFIWPVWARAHSKTQAERKKLARRFANEVLRLAMYGSLRAERYPEVARRLKKEL